MGFRDVAIGGRGRGWDPAGADSVPKELDSLRVPGDKSLKSAGFSGGCRPWTFSGEQGLRLRQHTYYMFVNSCLCDY